MDITDDKLLKIALVTSLIGLIGLIMFTPSIEVKEVKIKDISRGMIDEEVSIDCVVSDVKSSKSGSSYFLTITWIFRTLKTKKLMSSERLPNTTMKWK